MTTNSIHPIIRSWLTYLDQQGKPQTTRVSYRRALTLFVQWSEQSYGQSFDPAAIIPRDVTDWKSYQQTIEKAAPATINQRLAALSRFFKWAVAQSHCHTDPTIDVKGIRREKRQPKSLKNVPLRRFLRAVNKGGNLRDIAMVELMLGTGLRVSEVLALSRNDLALNERSGEVIVREGKGGQPRRIPLTVSVRRALAAYLAQYPDLDGNDLLWIGERGPLISPSGIFRLLKKYAWQAGVNEAEVSAHVFRHTFATRYLEANPDDLRGLAALLGHSNLDTVMIYTEPRTEDLVGRMERAEIGAEAADPSRT